MFVTMVGNAIAPRCSTLLQSHLVSSTQHTPALSRALQKGRSWSCMEAAKVRISAIHASTLYVCVWMCVFVFECVTRVSHCFHTAITLDLHCCYTAVTLLLRCEYPPYTLPPYMKQRGQRFRETLFLMLWMIIALMLHTFQLDPHET
jgi:hypothetical protein